MLLSHATPSSACRRHRRPPLQFPIVNRHLLKDLIERGLWNPSARLQIIANKGSVADVPGLPEDLKELYK
jgi:hypothetical protein